MFIATEAPPNSLAPPNAGNAGRAFGVDLVGAECL